MSDTPLYYIHHATPHSEDWKLAIRSRITTSQMLRILDYYNGQTSLDEVALEIMGDMSPPPMNDALVWNREHAREAREAHAKFHPTTTRLQPGLLVNGKYPWLSHTPDDFTWSSEGVGMTLYKCPYSKSMLRDPLPAHELQLCYGGAVCEWTRPLIDYVVWTPSASAIKHYTPETMLVTREVLTLKGLWDSYVLPRLSQFHSATLLPLLEQRGLIADTIYACPPTEYVAVRDPTQSVAELSASFA